MGLRVILLPALALTLVPRLPRTRRPAGKGRLALVTLLTLLTLVTLLTLIPLLVRVGLLGRVGLPAERDRRGRVPLLAVLRPGGRIRVGLLAGRVGADVLITRGAVSS